MGIRRLHCRFEFPLAAGAGLHEGAVDESVPVDGSDCSVFLDERSGTLFGCMKIEDEEKWQKIRDDVLCRKWLDHISPTVKVNRENNPEATPLRLVFHID